MSSVELRSEPAGQSDGNDFPCRPNERDSAKSRNRIVPILITVVTVALAALLAWAMWKAYMSAPWTRDGQVRAYVVMMASEVAGRVVELPVADNQFVHKGDLLMTIDPTDYRIAVSLAETAVQRAQANAKNLETEAKRRQELSTLATSIKEKQTYESNARIAQASYQQSRLPETPFINRECLGGLPRPDLLIARTSHTVSGEIPAVIGIREDDLDRPACLLGNKFMISEIDGQRSAIILHPFVPKLLENGL